MSEDFNVNEYKEKLCSSICRIDKLIAKLNVTAMNHYEDESLRELIFETISELQTTRKSLAFKLNKYGGVKDEQTESKA